MRQFIFTLTLSCLALLQANAQDLERASKHVEKLCSDEFHGRGYYEKGDQKAAEWIAQQFADFGLQAFDSILDERDQKYVPYYFQDFRFPVNTFPGDIVVQIDGHHLKAGVDYLVNAMSGGTAPKKFDIYTIQDKDLRSAKRRKKLRKKDLSSTLLLIDEESLNIEKFQEGYEAIVKNELRADGTISVKDRLIWSVGRAAFPFIKLEISREKMEELQMEKAQVTIEQELIKSYESQNVIGYVEGTTFPDSFIFFTAHYDHLGRMGDSAVFPGANDNATGTAMLIDLAHYYSQPENQLPYSVAFIGFGAEEAGLIGSYFYTQNPYFPLSNIMKVLNIDLMGDGSSGMMVVNGKIFPETFQDFVSLNEKNNYFKTIKKRGKAANSDHYYFSEKGVEAFFFYLMGDYPYYHDIYDIPENVPYIQYEETVQFFIDYLQILGDKMR